MNVKLKGWNEIFNFYQLTGISLFLGLLMFFLFYVLPLFEQKQFNIDSEAALIPLLFLSIALLSYLYKKRSLKMKEFIFSKEIQNSDLSKVAGAMNLKYRWMLKSKIKDDYVYIKNKTSIFDHSSKITIFHRNNKIFINSIGDPAFQKNGATATTNRDDISEFIRYLRLHLSGIDTNALFLKERELEYEEYLNESEFSMKKILSRVFVLLFGSAMTFVGFLSIQEGDYFGLPIILIPIIICVVYFY
jgi:hypothetical protein